MTVEIVSCVRVVIGRELRVGSLLEGNIRKAGNKPRIRAQLTDAGTEEHLWADKFDKEMGSLDLNSGIETPVRRVDWSATIGSYLGTCRCDRSDLFGSRLFFNRR